MGRRDNPELEPSEADLAEAEAATRQLLAIYDEPAPVEPPPGLAARVVAALPRPATRTARLPAWAALRPLAALAGAAVLLLALGALGALYAAPGLAAVAGSPDSALGQIGRALLATPVGGMLIGAGAGATLALVALAAGVWLWRRRK